MRFAFWASAAAAMLVAGCAGEPAAEADVVAEASAASDAEAVVFENNDQRGEYVREFAYNWPAAVSEIPALAARFTAERDAELARQRQDFADAAREFAGQDCIGCINRSYEKVWSVVADLPRYLSLSASVYMYTGGAHPNGTFDALVWDREAGVVLTAADFFASESALQQALGEGWCAALKAERQERMGPDFSDDGFFACPPIADLTLLLGSAGKQGFDRIGLLAAPYVAGSYAEGPYEVTLPVSPKVLDAVKPEYRAAFALPK
jgi:hypothetical protein